jgi:DNA-binding transcriptional LysR family regulator
MVSWPSVNAIAIVYAGGLSYDMIEVIFIPSEYDMELRHFRYFIAVAEEGHITRAAERLGMQQPPLSRQIKAIEQELDVQLFRRKARGVELTDAGRALLNDARAMLVHLDRSLESTRRAARGEQGRLSVGYTSAAACHPLVPRIIREFRKAFPLVSVTPAEAFPHDLIERIGTEQLDLTFVRTPVANAQGIVIDRLLEEGLVVALPAEHALAQGKNVATRPISLNALAGETFIFYGRPNGALTVQSNALVAACQAAGFNPHVGYIVPDMLSRLNLVAAGLGIVVVSASMQRMKIEGVAYRPIKGTAQLRAPLILVSRRGDHSAVVRQFVRLAKQTARNFRTG